MTTMRAMTICADGDALARRAAELFCEEAEAAITARGRFVVALAGGSTPEKMYELLAQPETAAKIQWDKIFCFFGDERFVAPDSEESNFGMARRTLLSRVPLPEGNVFEVNTSLPTVEDAAAYYERTLAAFFEVEPPQSAPAFDLILLGLGDDGHTASLFPGHSSLTVRDRWVISSPPGTLPPPVDRITFTFPLINAALHTLFLVSGAKKANIAQGVIGSDPGKEDYPAGHVLPTQGKLTWLLDRDAAAKLNQK